MIQNKVIAIIPARGGSKRLPQKNIYPFLGLPMITYSIEACRKSKYIDRIFVSTEDKKIANISKKFEAEIINRPEHLSRDHVWLQEVLKHAVLDVMERGVKFDLIARIQASSPMVEAGKIDEAIEKLVKHNLWEVSSMNRDGVEDAAIHILKKDVVFQNALSVYKGIVITDYIDIHTKGDIKRAEELLKIKLNNKYAKN
jgi:CMP-N,N'-diacetyllegionaminic acid synthase